MVKFILVTLFMYSFSTRANLFDFGASSGKENKIPTLVEKLKNFDMKEGPAFEEAFNQIIKAIENAVEEEKLYCAGESVDNQGKTLATSQKQLCMRDLKKQYLNAMDAIYDSKKKYLGHIHQRQLEKMSESQNQLRKDIEKNF